MAVGEAILSAFLQVVFDRLTSREVIDFARRWNIDSDLKKLERTLWKIKAVLNDAEEKQINNNLVKVWLNDLNHLAYDAEDVLDEFATEALRWKLEAESQTDAIQVWNFNITTSLCPTVVWFKSEIGSKIKEITEKLEDIAKERFELGLKEGVGGKSTEIRQRLPSSSLVDESGVFGREEDKKKIIEQVLSDEASGGNKVTVIPIVGMGGIGKTTLAQLVYNDKIVDEYFDLKAWACVSEEFDVLRVTKTIFESVKRNQCNFMDLNLLQVELKEALNGKKFLLVLDDVWNQNYNDWDVLRNPFIYGAQGSKIIVTTRSVTVSSIMRNVPAYHLGLLSNEDCQSLFVKHAFANKNSDTRSKLEVIGKKIVAKCKGLPLATKTIGGLLRSKENEGEWEDILNSEIWELKEEESEILPALKLSYHHLSAHLKRCFAYCSIFPKDYIFNKVELVLLWMAEGFVQPERKKRMEDVGGTYFDDLLQMSFFQQSSSYNWGFVMHDLVNDLARVVSGEICFRLESDDSYRISEKARHLSYHSDTYDVIKKFEAFHELVFLRTFLPLIPWMKDRSYLPRQVRHNLFSRLRCLRVLCLKKYNINKLPDSIENLRHLRYLDLSFTKIKRLPESTCTLYNLQILLLRGCKFLTKLPQNTGNLINLRHLDIYNCSRLQKMPMGIGRLTSLQTLPIFVVSENSGSIIRELRDMSDLRGKLHISMLKNIINHMDAMEANLRNKQHIGTLELEWNSSSFGDNFESMDEGFEENVLGCLQPHRDLKELTIKCYGGIGFPGWIGDPSFSSLVILNIWSCRKCKALPPLGQLPSLQELSIRGINGVKSVGREFCGDGSGKQFVSLKKLNIGDMPECEEWSGIEEKECEEFPCLLELSISYCPKLRKVSLHFPVLVKLDIKHCEELTAFPKLLSRGNFEEGEAFPRLHDLVIEECPNLLPSLVQLDNQQPTALPRLPMLRKLLLDSCDEKVLGSMVEVTSLTSLSISRIPNLAFLPKGFLQHLTALEELRISHCYELVALSEEFGIQHFTSLRELIISYCPGLVSFSETTFPATLKLLHIIDCKNLKFLHEGMMPSNTSLEELVIDRCQSLTSFPRGLGLSTAIKLKKLKICNCMNLESLPEGLRVLTSLQSLEIILCPRLVSFPEGGLPITNLREVSIRGCENLNSLPDQIHSLTSIQILEIRSCPNLVSIPEGGLPTNCKALHISDCKKLEPLTNMELQRLTSLTKFNVNGFPGPISFSEWLLPTTLTSLNISEILNLESLSKGLHNLTSLKSLRIFGCPKLASLPKEGLPTTLTSLDLQRLLNLESLSKGLHNLTSLQVLTIMECPKLASLSEEGMPTTLTSLYIRELLNLESLPKGLHNLTSLQDLTITYCPKLAFLSDEVLPTTLSRICILDCPLLAKRCQKEKGEDWPKIAHIPCMVTKYSQL